MSSSIGTQMLEIWNDIPNVLDIGERRGQTDYIDFLSLDDFKPLEEKCGKSLWVVKGRDCFNRPFMCFKMQQRDAKAEDKMEDVVFTIFQRFSDDPLRWHVAGGAQRWLGLVVTDKNISTVRELVAGQTVAMHIQDKFYFMGPPALIVESPKKELFASQKKA